MSREPTSKRDQGDDVARLVRLAGQRDPVPGERAARARAAAHDAWMREIRRRSRNRLIWGGTALAAAASLVLAVIGLGRPPSPDGGPERAGVGGSLPVELQAGAARVRELADGSLAAAREMIPAETLPPGSLVATGADRRAALRLPSGHSLRLDVDTAVRMDAGGTLHLDRGALYLSSAGKASSGSPLRVITPLGSLQEAGTQYAARLAAGALQVRVREGAVVLHGIAEDREIPRGTEMVVRPDGSTATRAIPTHGAPWSWVSRVTPMIDLEGRTARSFLDWAARERGWSLSFASEELSRSAAETVVQGDIRGMTVEQALEAVLPSCNMTHRLEGGTLEILPLR